MLAQSAQAVDQDRSVPGGITRRHERWQPTGEHAISRRGHGARPLDFGHHCQLGGHLGDGVLAQYVVESADEMRHVDAHGGHHDTILLCAFQFRQPGGELEVSGAAEFDPVEAVGRCRLELLLETGTWQMLLLAAQSNHDISRMTCSAWSGCWSMSS